VQLLRSRPPLEQADIVAMLRQLAAVVRPERCVGLSRLVAWLSRCHHAPVLLSSATCQCWMLERISPCACADLCQPAACRDGRQPRLAVRPPVLRTPLRLRHACRVAPLSHTAHCKQFSVEDTQTTTLMKSLTKAKTLGLQKKVKASQTAPAGSRGTPACDAAWLKGTGAGTTLRNAQATLPGDADNNQNQQPVSCQTALVSLEDCGRVCAVQVQGLTKVPDVPLDEPGETIKARPKRKAVKATDQIETLTSKVRGSACLQGTHAVWGCKMEQQRRQEDGGAWEGKAGCCSRCGCRHAIDVGARLHQAELFSSRCLCTASPLRFATLQVPLKWATSTIGPMVSTMKATHNGAPNHATQVGADSCNAFLLPSLCMLCSSGDHAQI